jgi:hypothetical protein
MSVRVDQDGVDEVMSSREMVAFLATYAQGVVSRAQPKAPSWLEASWGVKAGVGPRGAFAQAVAQGSGTVAAEFGGQHVPVYAYLRSSL